MPIKKLKKDIYAIGYEGLEDCYISEQIKTDLGFDIDRSKVTYIHIDSQLDVREMTSSITYYGEEIEW